MNRTGFPGGFILWEGGVDGKTESVPGYPDRQDLLLVDDLSTKRRFGDAAERRAFILDLHALHPRPRRRAVTSA